MQTNQIKKGDKIKLHNGWFGVMYDNKKGNIRMAEVDGFHKEIGSIYVWDISHCYDPESATWIEIELTDKQKQAQAIAGRVFG